MTLANPATPLFVLIRPMRNTVVDVLNKLKGDIVTLKSAQELMIVGSKSSDL